MGAIKDIGDLLTQLNSSILKIQTLMLTVQEEDAALVSENLDLKKKIFELEKKYSEFEEKHSAPQEKSSTKDLEDKHDFIEELGIYKSKESGHYFCAFCLMKNVESPLTERRTGWRCELKDCGKFYTNPAYQTPKRKPRKPFQW